MSWLIARAYVYVHVYKAVVKWKMAVSFVESKRRVHNII